MTDQYKIQNGDSFYRVAQRLGVSVERLSELNPEIDDPTAIQIGQIIHIPDLEGNPDYHQHVVAAGDNLTKIAQLNGVPMADLLAFNPLLEDPNALEIGQRINVPAPGHEAYESYADQIEGRTQNYQIKSGDTLSEIAHERGLNVEALMRANPEIKSAADIRAGQVIAIPLEATTTPVNPPNFYTVKSGDTFSEIALANGVSERALRQANPDVSNPSRLNVGQRLAIPESDRPSGLGTLREASERELAFGVDRGAIDRSWDKVEGKTSKVAFQQVSMDTRPLIVIDPGHGADNRSGGNDPGAVSEVGDTVGMSEVHFVDPVSLALGQRLADMGFRVAYTRTPGEEYRYSAADEPGRLESRAEFAHALEDQVGAPYTVFVSVHANAAGDPSGNGMEIQIDNAEKGRHGPAESADSYALASSVMNHIGGYKGLKIRHGDGVDTYNASVLDKMENGDPTNAQPDVAMIIEPGFLSNERDAAILNEIRQNPEEFAGLIANGIRDYVHSRDPAMEPQGGALMAGAPKPLEPGQG